jgi:hypothetical protein
MAGQEGPVEPASATDPTELAERPESEQFPEERPYTELFGLPAMIFLIALVALIKGIFEQQLGFTIIGALACGGVLLSIGLSMTIAKREEPPASSD